MHAFTFLLALGLVGSAFAAPITQPNVDAALFAKDPLSIHRRSVIPVLESVSTPTEEIALDDSAAAASSATPEVAVAIAVTEPEFEAVTTETTRDDNSESESEPTEESCMAVCGMQRVEGAKSEREALCSASGLQVTLSCAQCIDTTWPDTTWEDSAMAEYERIVSACQDASQRTFRR